MPGEVRYIRQCVQSMRPSVTMSNAITESLNIYVTIRLGTELTKGCFSNLIQVKMLVRIIFM